MKCVVDENLYQTVLRSVSNEAFGIPEQHHVPNGSKEKENAEYAVFAKKFEKKTK